MVFDRFTGQSMFDKPLLRGATEEKRKESRKALLKAKTGFLKDIEKTKKKEKKARKKLKGKVGKLLKEAPFKLKGVSAPSFRFRNIRWYKHYVRNADIEIQ